MKNYLLNGEATERLLFRRLLRTDFAHWLPFHRDPRTSEFWKGLPKDPVAACRLQFNSTFERYNKGLGGMNALILKSTHTLVGLCGLLHQTVDGIQELEIAYSILPDYWQQGYATEAANKCREFAKANYLSTSLISIIQVDNLPSQKVAIKNGLCLEKTTSYRGNQVHIFRIHL